MKSVWRDGKIAGLIAWAPARPALFDVACALEHTAPFRDDEECARWLRYPRPPSHRCRIEVFHGACSIADPENVSALVAQQQRTVAATCADLARRSIEPQATLARDGHLAKAGPTSPGPRPAASSSQPGRRPTRQAVSRCSPPG